MDTKHTPKTHKLSSADKWEIVWTLVIVLLGSGCLGSLAVHLTTRSV